MTDVQTLIDTYFDMWNEPDTEKRTELVERAWTADGRHVDPLADVTGHDAIAELVAGVHAQYPGHDLRRTTGVDVHHDQVRYGWELASPGGDVVVTAVDVGEVAVDGRLRRVTAFFGDPPERS